MKFDEVMREILSTDALPRERLREDKNALARYFYIEDKYCANWGKTFVEYYSHWSDFIAPRFIHWLVKNPTVGIDEPFTFDPYDKYRIGAEGLNIDAGEGFRGVFKDES